MILTLSIISPLLIIIATIGFLILKFFYEDKIDALSTENRENITSQRDVLDFINRANFEYNNALLTNNHIQVLELLQSPNPGIEKVKKRRRLFYFFSVLQSANAMIASKETNENIEDLLKDLKNQRIEKLREFYEKFSKRAASGSQKLGDIVKKNQKERLEKENRKNCLFYIFLTCQSMGLLCGLLIYILKVL